MEYKHTPVMLDEVLEFLNLEKGKKIIDCTFGGGGYSLAILKKVGKNGEVLAFDLDKMAIENGKRIIKRQKIKNLKLIQDNFKNLKKYTKTKKYDGIVLDLGLSSAQLSDQKRGFSFRLNSRLDMSFAGDGEETFKIINSYEGEELIKIFKNYGEEKFAKRIVEKIIKKRKEKEIKNTAELVELIKEAVPLSYTKRKIHFATKVFQALRIATNKELEALEELLNSLTEVLSSGARIVVVSYHSLEDRIVKNFFRQEERNCICPPERPICDCGHKAILRRISKKPILPKKEEVRKNPRARSAKMRVAEIL